MGLYHIANYLFIIYLSQAVVECLAFELRDRNFRRSQYPVLHGIQRATNPYNHKEITYHWRRPKTLPDVKASTDHFKRSHYAKTVSRHKHVSSTPSQIEFDYLAEDSSQVKNTSLKRFNRVDTHNRRASWRGYKTKPPSTLRSSSASYRIVDPYNEQELLPISKTQKIIQDSSLFSYDQAFIDFKIKKPDKMVNDIGLNGVIKNKTYLNGTLPTVKVSIKDSQAQKTTVNLPVQSTTSATTTAFTTLGDRIKFFELYDTNTLRPTKKELKLNDDSDYHSSKIPEIVSITENVTDKIINEESNIPSKFWRLDNMNKANLERYKYFRKRSFKSDGHGNILSPIPKNYTSESRATSKKYSQTLNVVFSKTEPLTKTFVAQWSSYPFASVYVYEPKQTHCDASGISPHWLLAAGSCLSRHNLEYSIDDRSAYVTYCGVHWRSPERIAYVKRILLHPNFNLRDKVRRLLFNVGLIQVASSMSTSCPGWTPVAMMSHQFFASSAGSMAQAVGWGLDRYGSQYATEEIPHCPLTVYEALVYHDTCPGSTTFSTAKQQGDSGAENVYCLLLPAYSGEENDSVHGGMLLVGGKMIALYLQEERRSWGSQSAQYTGVWRLLPWITDVAHEHEDVEIPIDI